MFTLLVLLLSPHRAIIAINVIKLPITIGTIIGFPTMLQIHGFNLISRLDQFHSRITLSNPLDIQTVIFCVGRLKVLMI
jgi:hypothetical protein